MAGASSGSPSPDLHIRGLQARAVTSLGLEDASTNTGILQLQCRICLMEGPSEDDPLIQPCECTGSIKYVHANCLARWIDGRLGFNGGKTFKPAFFFRPVACELCHSSYPSYYKTSYSNQAIPLAALPPVRTPFKVFENIGGTAAVPPWNNDHSNTFPAGLHIVSLPEAEFSSIKIGRGHDCELRISDVSISRLHAQIKLIDGHFYLQDEKSKFGTLLAIQDRVIPVPHHSANPSFITLQCGRTVIVLSALSPDARDSSQDLSSSSDDLTSISPLSPQNR